MRKRFKFFGIILTAFFLFSTLVYYYLPIEYKLQIKKVILYSNNKEELYMQEGKKLIYKSYPYAKKNNRKYRAELYQKEDDEWQLILYDPNVDIGGGFDVTFNSKLEVKSIGVDD